MNFKKSELGNLIKEIRLSKQLTQDQFAKLCEIKSFQNISNIERGIK
ncbi:helix-turn-helix domain-containing protein, partial [Loigolactobacillus coryniformis]